MSEWVQLGQNQGHEAMCVQDVSGFVQAGLGEEWTHRHMSLSGPEHIYSLTVSIALLTTHAYADTHTDACQPSRKSPGPNAPTQKLEWVYIGLVLEIADAHRLCPHASHVSQGHPVMESYFGRTIMYLFINLGMQTSRTWCYIRL